MKALALTVWNKKIFKAFSFGCHGNHNSSRNSNIWSILKVHHPRTISVKFYWNLLAGFRGEYFLSNCSRTDRRSVYPRAEWKGTPPCPFFSPALVPLEPMYMRPAALHIDLCTFQKSGVCYYINHVLRQYTSITTDIEFAIVKLLTDGIVYHTYSS